MIGIIIMIAAVTGLIIVISMALHELGHYLYWRFAVNKNVKFIRGFNVRGIYKKGEVTKQQLYLYYFSGILWGLMPIVFFMNISFYYSMLLLIAYAAGCSSDLKKIWGLIRWEGGNN